MAARTKRPEVRPPYEAYARIMGVFAGGLAVAGAWTATGWPATMEGAVRSGVVAAHAALSDLAVVGPAREEALAS